MAVGFPRKASKPISRILEASGHGGERFRLDDPRKEAECVRLQKPVQGNPLERGYRIPDLPPRSGLRFQFDRDCARGLERVRPPARYRGVKSDPVDRDRKLDRLDWG